MLEARPARTTSGNRSSTDLPDVIPPTPPRPGPVGEDVGAPSRRQLLTAFVRERREPDRFSQALAAHSLSAFPFPLAGSRVIDLGAGRAHHRQLLRAAGAWVVAVDLDPALLGAEPSSFDDATTGPSLAADARSLPVATATVDGIFCSNLLEHTPRPLDVLDEAARVLRPGGWAWVSWTNWYSPWGGHEIAPFHYLGAERGLAVATRVRGAPRRVLPGRNLFPTHIGTVLRHLRSAGDYRILRATPRYYPSQSWILRVPGLREVATWNCLLLLERTARR